MQFLDILSRYLDIAIFSTLGFMGFLSIWLSIERIIFYARVKFLDYKNELDLEEGLSKNMTALYIIYSNAPYIGLLGTVGGIILTFYGISQGNEINAKKIMSDLSLALEATGAGLLVAIPTLMVYNIFQRKIDVILSRYKSAHAS
ncbi:MAG: TonB-system energizer ExbB [Helicobacter sp.]|nr:TonB-system energizer ExbB [Helicobacter sp.]